MLNIGSKPEAGSCVPSETFGSRALKLKDGEKGILGGGVEVVRWLR